MAECVYVLLEEGASADCRDGKGRTAWEVCEDHKCQEVTLSSCRADIPRVLHA